MGNGTSAGSSRSFENQTVRQIVQITAGGTRVCIRLSNEYGVGPLIIGFAHIAFRSKVASIVAETECVAAGVWRVLAGRDSGEHVAVGGGG